MLKMVIGAFIGSMIMIIGLAITTMVAYGILSVIFLHPVLFLLLIGFYFDIKMTVRECRNYK